MADDLAQPFSTAATLVESVPRGQEQRQRRRIHGSDFVAKSCEIASFEPSQDLSIAPVELDAAGADFTAHQHAVGFQRREHGFQLRSTKIEALAHLACQERSAMPGEALDERFERALHRQQE